MSALRPSLSLVLAAALLAGCPAVGGVQPLKRGPGAAPTASPRVAATTGPTAPGTGEVPGGGGLGLEAAKARVSGVVRLISDKGLGIVSNNGGALVSNNGGALIANNGGGVIANHGGGLVAKAPYATGAKAPYGLLAKAPESMLADAEVTVVDATGNPVKGRNGEPLVARTDGEGRFALRGLFPAGTLVLRVKLWNGGELRAMFVPPTLAGATQAQDVDTASSLGAAFVLERLVKGDQALLDKLPAAEAGRLTRELEASRELLAAPPAYEPARLADAAAELRGKAPAVNAALKAIEALLLGQSNLGDGRPATEVPLNRPYAVLLEPSGDLLIGESGMGRVRVVDKAGRLTTRIDRVRGTIKQNFQGLQDLCRADDGTLYVASHSSRQVVRIKPDGAVDVFWSGREKGVLPTALALGPDGTLYVGGRRPQGNARFPYMIAVSPDGAVKELPPPNGTFGSVVGLAVGPDGTRFVLQIVDGETVTGQVYAVPAAGEPRLLAADLAAQEESGMVLAPDGTLYVGEMFGRRVLAIPSDGAPRPLPGPETAGGEAFDQPAAVCLGPDGTLYVADIGTARVQARSPDGTWRVIAGVNDAVQGGDGRTLALNTPIGLCFDAQGGLLIAENGRNRVVRFADGRLSPFAGTTKGFGGDGGPATAARFSGLSSVAAHAGTAYVADTVNWRIRRIGADGGIDSVAGGGGRRPPMLTAPIPAAEANPRMAVGLTVDPQGRPVWTSAGVQQVHRLVSPTEVDLVAGRPQSPDEAPSLGALAADVLTDGEPAATATLRFPMGIAYDARGDLLVADAGHMQVRRVSGLGGAMPTIAAFAGRGPVGLAALLGGGEPLGDAPALEADLIVPAGIAIDAAGNVYVSELGTRRLDLLSTIFPAGLGLDSGALPPVPARVRKIAKDGTVTTLAGPGGKFFPDPDAEDALVLPTAIAISPDGRMAIADPGANLVRILPVGSW